MGLQPILHGAAVDRSLARMPPPLRPPVIAAFAVVYALLTWIGRLTVVDGLTVSLICPAAGVATLWILAESPRLQWRMLGLLVLVHAAMIWLTGASLVLTVFGSPVDRRPDMGHRGPARTPLVPDGAGRRRDSQLPVTAGPAGRHVPRPPRRACSAPPSARSGSGSPPWVTRTPGRRWRGSPDTSPGSWRSGASATSPGSGTRSGSRPARTVARARAGAAVDRLRHDDHRPLPPAPAAGVPRRRRSASGRPPGSGPSPPRCMCLVLGSIGLLLTLVGFGAFARLDRPAGR